MRPDIQRDYHPNAFLAFFLTVYATLMAWSTQIAQALVPSQFHADEAGEASMGQLGSIIIVVIAAVLSPIVVMLVLAQLLPDYLSALNDTFNAFDAQDTTSWPGLVAVVFTFAPIVIGVIAISALFGLGGLLAIRVVRRGF